MYNEHFGFRESPFTTTPNSRLFYSNDHYREALANLRYGIEWRKGLIVMTGEVGTGKTTLMCKTTRDLAAAVQPIFVSYDHLTSVELLRIISRELSLSYDPQDRLATIAQLRDHLLAKHRKDETVALLIDEAQNLSDEMFEDIRFLSNIETESDKLLQIVLTGQPELETRLADVHLRHIRQRVVVHCRLTALKNHEVGHYIATRLREAGYEGAMLFSAEALREIARYSEGIPRLINIICDNALLLAYAQSQTKVKAEMIREVVRDLGLSKRIPAAAACATSASNASDDPPMPASAGGEPLRVETRQKIGIALIPAGVCLALVAIGSAGGSLYSWPMKGYFHQPVPGEHRPSESPEAGDQLSQARPSTQVAETPSDVPAMKDPSQALVASSATSGPKKASKDSSGDSQQQRAASGVFQVSGPSAFVRGAPRANSRIIATLPPRTTITVLSVTGNYYRVQASMDGQKVRGYVHREDAFFERIRSR